MLKYPISVFLDTNIFVATKYDFSEKGIFNILKKFIATGKINLYISSVVKGEILNRIKGEISKIDNKFKEARNFSFKTISINYLEQWSFSYLFSKPDKKQMLTEIIMDFETFLKNTNTTILDCSDIDCNQIIEDYFEGNPPFANSDNKRFEFPDAIMISKLKSIFNEENSVFVVSDDNKFREALKGHKGIETYDSLKEIFDLINKEQEIAYGIIVDLISDDMRSILCQSIYSALDKKDIDVDGTDCDRKGICHGYYYDDVYIDSIKDVDYKFISINEISADTVSVIVEAKAFISAICSYVDEDNSIWDSEEKEYIFLERINVYEEHTPEFECEFIFKNEIDEHKAELDIISINFDLQLNKDTRYKREIIPSSNPEEDAYADKMDALEEYYKH